MKLILLFATIALSVCSSIASAGSYDTARKILDADKQTRDYQAAQAGGYGFIYDDTSMGETVIAIISIAVLVAIFYFVVIPWFRDLNKYSDKEQKTKEARPIIDRLLQDKWLSITDDDYTELVPFASLKIGDAFVFILNCDNKRHVSLGIKSYSDMAIVTAAGLRGSLTTQQPGANSLVKQISLA